MFNQTLLRCAKREHIIHQNSNQSRIDRKAENIFRSLNESVKLLS